MSQPIALMCPNCDAPLNTPPGRDQFFCQYCGTSVAVPATDSSEDTGDASTRAPKPAVAIPNKLRIEDLGSELIISWRWFTWAVLFLIPFCIAWNSFLIGWYSMLGGIGDDGPPLGFRLIFYVFPIGHVAVGVGLFYFCLVSLFNRTTVRVGRGELCVAHGPFYWPGRLRIPVDNIKQLYCTHKKRTDSDGDTTHQYTLTAQLGSGRAVKLVPNSELEVIQAVEQLVEKYLGIVDGPVRGEHRS